MAPIRDGNPEELEEAHENGGEKRDQLQAEDKQFPFHRLLAYADGVDWLLMALGTVGSVVHGMAQPIGYLLLGKALDAFGSNINNDQDMVDALNRVRTVTVLLQECVRCASCLFTFRVDGLLLLLQVIPFVWAMAFATLPAGFVGGWQVVSFSRRVFQKKKNPPFKK